MTEIQKIAELIKGKPLVALRKHLETMFKKKDIDFTYEPIPHFRIKSAGKTILICNEKYADVDEIEVVVDNMAVGYE